MNGNNNSPSILVNNHARSNTQARLQALADPPKSHVTLILGDHVEKTPEIKAWRAATECRLNEILNKAMIA